MMLDFVFHLSIMNRELWHEDGDESFLIPYQMRIGWNIFRILPRIYWKTLSEPYFHLHVVSISQMEDVFFKKKKSVFISAKHHVHDGNHDGRWVHFAYIRMDDINSMYQKMIPFNKHFSIKMALLIFYSISHNYILWNLFLLHLVVVQHDDSLTLV